MSKVVALLAVLTALVAGNLATSPVACACSCRQYASPQEAVRAYEAIFNGKVTREDKDDDSIRYEIDVSQVYRGNVGATVVVSTAVESTACGASLPVGDVLIFAQPRAPAHFSISSCGPATLRSFDLKEVTEQVFGEPEPPDPDAPTATLAADSTVTYVLPGVAAVVVLGGAGAVVALVLFRRRRRR